MVGFLIVLSILGKNLFSRSSFLMQICSDHAFMNSFVYIFFKSVLFELSCTPP